MRGALTYCLCNLTAHHCKTALQHRKPISHQCGGTVWAENRPRITAKRIYCTAKRPRIIAKGISNIVSSSRINARLFCSTYSAPRIHAEDTARSATGYRTFTWMPSFSNLLVSKNSPSQIGTQCTSISIDSQLLFGSATRRMGASIVSALYRVSAIVSRK